MRKKALSWLLAVSMILSLFAAMPITANADDSYDGAINIIDGTGTGVGWAYASGEVWINENGSYFISGDGIQTTNRIQVKAGVTATVTLENVNINVNLPFNCGDNSNVTVILVDNSVNTFNGYGGHAGLRVAPTATITITTIGQSIGNGSLSAYGGADTSSNWASAGIGGSELESSGAIIINGGTIFAKGGDGRTPGAWRGPGATGIGGASGRACGDITINGGTVTAIGGGVNPEGAGIGGGGSDPSTYSGKITINGGTVRAYSGGLTSDSGTGIGFCSSVAIADTADVQAYSSGIYPAIYGTTAESGHSAYLLNFMLDARVSLDTDMVITQTDDSEETFEMTLPAGYKNFATTVETANNYTASLSDGSKKIVSFLDGSTAFPGILDLPGTALSSTSVKLKAKPVCMIGSTEYETLGEALTAVTNNQTIKLLTDITHNSTIASDSAGFNLNLNLNGYTLTVNAPGSCLFANGANINVFSSVESSKIIANTTQDGSIALRAESYGTIVVNAPLTINALSSNSKGIRTYAAGTVTVTDAIINATDIGVEAYGDWNNHTDASTINVTGNITASDEWADYGAYAYSGGVVRITGDVVCSGSGVLSEGGKISVTGDVTGGSIGAYAYSGNIDVTGNVSATHEDGYGAYASNNGSIEISGNVNATGTGSYGAGVAYTSSVKIDGVINAPFYVNLGGGVLPVGNTYEPTTLGGYNTYAYASDLSNVVWVKNHALAVEDTWISEAYTADINGAHHTLETGITVSEGSSGYALVRFDVSSLPDSAEVIKLQLRFSGISSAGGHLSKVTAHKITSAWDEDNVSYSTRPTWDSAIIDTFDGTIFGTGYIGDVWEWDITELYNQWKENPSTNFGVLLSAPIPFVDLYASQGFYSKEGAPDDVYAPRLVFEESTCIVPGCTDPHADGAFTESEMIMGVEYYHISTAEQLAHINEHLDLNYIQTADIDLAQYNGGLWNPIGGNLGYEAFSGRYMGNSKQIINMTIDTSSTDDSDLYAGLFGLTTSDAHIEGINLTINSMSAVQDIFGSGQVYMGGITATHESLVTIENCHVTINGNLTATSYGGDVFVGGIAGHNTGNITDCSTTTLANSTITVAAPSREAFVGGIAGYTSGNILNSDNVGKLHAEAAGDTYTRKVYVGGIAGYAADSSTDTIIENCQNDADIESINYCDVENTYRAYAGGIVGHIDWNDSVQSVIIRNCANISKNNQVYTKAPSTLTGGIAGSARFVPQTNITIENCYNRSNIISDMLNFNWNKGPEYCTGVTAGGIIGAAGGIRVQYCYSTAADISAVATEGEDAYKGGIAGLIWGTRLSEDYYETNANIAVGIGGAVDDSMTIVPQADLAGEVEAATKAQLQAKSFFGDGWQWYTGGGTAPDYYDSTAPWRMTAANTYPVLKGAAYTEPTPPSGGGGSYTPSTYNIIATANTGGTITPNGSSAVTEYSNLKFTIKPDTSYIIQDVLVDGISVGAVTEYTFTSVKANHTIEAKFAHDCPSKPFIDVDTTQWYHDGIDYVLLEGLFKGTSATTFEPNTSMTRAMLVTVLYRLEGTPAAAIGNPFSDVASGNWYADAVVWANAKGIVKGYDSDTFGTNDFITREQLATILYRYAQYKGYDVSVGEDTNILSYEDAFNISEYALPAVQWACGAGIMQGDAAKLDPQGNATRAQVAAMLMRFIENVAK